MSVYLQLVYWKPFSATTGLPKIESVAIMTPNAKQLMKKNDKIRGYMGITKGFVNDVITFEIPEEIVLPIYHHMKDKILDVVIENDNGRKVLYVIGDTGIIVNGIIVNENIPNGRYGIELHGETEWLSKHNIKR